MRKLNDSYWDQFTYNISSEKKVRDGIKFEDLIERLLAIEYKANWIRTSKSHDDSRDFYLTTTDYTQWAECKNYTSSISLETIAPTLVMAQIFDVNKIIFFSYSEVNRFAKKKIYAFGERTGKEIEIFAENTLDELILRNREFLSKSFQPTNEQINNSVSPKDIDIYFHFIQTPVIGNTQEDKLLLNITNVQKITYNTPFEINVFCLNNALKDSYNIELTLDHAKGVDHCYFTPVNADFSDMDSVHEIKKIPSAGGIVLRYFFKSNNFRAELTLPVFKIIVRDGDKIVKESFSPIHKVRNEWIGKTILVGEQYRNILKDTENKVLNNDTVSCLAVYGSSGTGKTRLLKESVELLLKHKYRAISFIGNETDSTYILLKELIYFVFEVPGDEILLEMQTNKGIKDIIETNGAANQAYNLAQSFNSARSTDELIEIIDTSFDIIYEKLSQERIAIIIDNIQFFDKALTHFLIRYLIYSKHQTRKNQSVTLLSVNLDYVTEDSNQLLEYIKELSKDYYHIIHFEIKGFQNENNGILFLRELLQLKNDSLDAELKTIIRKASLKPYCIYQAVYYLFEDGSIKQIREQKGYIISMERFHDAISEMPSDVNRIIKRRWEMFLEKNNELREDIQLVISALYIFRVLTYQIINLLELSQNVISLLIDKYFLKKEKDGIIYFEHDIIEGFLVDYYPNLESKAIEQINNCCVIHELSNHPFVYYFYKLFYNNASYILLEDIRKATPSLNIPMKLIPKYFNELLELVFRKGDIFPSLDCWMQYIQEICDLGKNKMGIQKAEFLFQKTYQKINDSNNQHIYFTVSFRKFINKYADLLFYQRKHLEAIKYLSEIDLLTAESVIKNDIFYALKSMIYNRLYINYRELKSKSHKAKATNCLRYSKEYVTKLKSSLLRDEFTYLNISDEGYDFYCLFETKESLLAIWEQCMNYPPEKLPEKAMNYFRKCIQIFLLNQKPLEAIDKISEAQEYMLLHPSSNNENLVFSFSFSMYQIMALVMDNPTKNITVLLEKMEEAYQLSELLSKKNWIDLLNLHAIICFYNGDVDGTYYHYKEAYEKYIQINFFRNFEEKRKLLIDNIFIAFSHFDCLSKASDFLTAEDTEYITALNNHNNHYVARGIQQTIDGLFNLPCI